jgi:deazaflavin-dependent oxidoreductase (nitroreductase family)
LKKTRANSSLKDSNVAPEQYLYLTTRGRTSGLPRPIEIWFTEREGRFYIIAECPSAQWLRNVQADPQVQVRVGDQTFAAKARVLATEADASLRSAIQKLSREKYWGDGTIVELERL